MSETVWRKVLAWFSCGSELGGQDPHWNQVVSESVHGARLAAAQLAKCGVCVEETKGYCKCGDQDEEHSHSTKSNTNNASALNIDDGRRHPVNADSSFAHSVINMVGMLIGLGQLSTPYALEQGGWSSAFLLVGLGAMCAYTSHIIGKCLRESPKSKDYQDIGHRAFGTKGRVLAAAFIYLEIFMALVSYTISLSDNLARVFAGVHLRLPGLPAAVSTPQLLTTLAVLVALPSLWLRDLSSISFLSMAGILMSALIFATVVCTALFGGVQANQSIPVLDLRKIPAISGLYMFSFAGHIVFPNIYSSMKDPTKFTKVSITSFTLVTALYTALAFTGAKMFGPSVKSQITLSMPPHLVATKIALWATVLTPMTKYALEFAPFAMQLEHGLPAWMGAGMRKVVRGGVGSGLLLLILCLALSVPYFEYVLGLTGSLVSVAICVVFPCACYLRICWAKVSKPAVALNVTLMAAGAVLAVVGTISSSKSLVRSFRVGHSAG